MLLKPPAASKGVLTLKMTFDLKNSPILGAWDLVASSGETADCSRSTCESSDEEEATFLHLYRICSNSSKKHIELNNNTDGQLKTKVLDLWHQVQTLILSYADAVITCNLENTPAVSYFISRHSARVNTSLWVGVCDSRWGPPLCAASSTACLHLRSAVQAPHVCVCVCAGRVSTRTARDCSLAEAPTATPSTVFTRIEGREREQWGIQGEQRPA